MELFRVLQVFGFQPIKKNQDCITLNADSVIGLPDLSQLAKIEGSFVDGEAVAGIYYRPENEQAIIDKIVTNEFLAGVVSVYASAKYINDGVIKVDKYSASQYTEPLKDLCEFKSDKHADWYMYYDERDIYNIASCLYRYKYETHKPTLLEYLQYPFSNIWVFLVVAALSVLAGVLFK